MPDSEHHGRARDLAAGLLGHVANGLAGAQARLADAARVARFLHGHLAFRGRPDDIWIVTYPRSGTTLMQYAVHRLLGRGDDFDHIGEVAPWYERDLAIGHRRAADLEARPSPRVFKSHLPHGWVPAGARVIYIERDGRDVAVSYYHLYREYLGFEGTFDEFFARFLDGHVQYRSYFRHVAGWRAHARGPNVLWVRFEDLRADRRGTLARVADFIGDAATDLDGAVAATEFAAMKRLEPKFDHATALLLERGVHRGRFIRRGAVGDGATTLDPAQQRAFAAKLADPGPIGGRPLRLAEFLR